MCGVDTCSFSVSSDSGHVALGSTWLRNEGTTNGRYTHECDSWCPLACFSAPYPAQTPPPPPPAFPAYPFSREPLSSGPWLRPQLFIFRPNRSGVNKRFSWLSMCCCCSSRVGKRDSTTPYVHKVQAAQIARGYVSNEAITSMRWTWFVGGTCFL